MNNYIIEKIQKPKEDNIKLVASSILVGISALLLIIFGKKALNYIKSDDCNITKLLINGILVGFPLGIILSGTIMAIESFKNIINVKKDGRRLKK